MAHQNLEMGLSEPSMRRPAHISFIYVAKSHIWDVNYYLEKKYKKILQTIFWMNFYVDYKSNNHQFQTPTLLLCIDF